MYNRNDNIPRWRRENGPPPSIPEEPLYPDDLQTPYARPPRSASLREWLAALSSVQQLGYGCMVIMLISAALVYCVGAATFLVRPMLAERAAITPTEVIRPTLIPTPTQEVRPSFIPLPTGQLMATPTQAPIPTREPPTLTATPETVNGMTVTPSATPTGKASATRKPTATSTAVARP